MSDIFLSYASADRTRAQILAQALEMQGWSVWWDRNIPAGKIFDEVIGNELDIARCVVVLWSQTSVKSDWVKEEASEGIRRKILVPVLIDEVNIPLGFRRIQAARLVNWQGSCSDPDFKRLVVDISNLLRSPPTVQAKQPSTASELPPSPWELEAKKLLREGKKIAAIAIVRKAKKMGLKESKDLVEMWEKKL